MKKINSLKDIDITTSEGYVLYNVVHFLIGLKQNTYSNADHVLKLASKDIKEDDIKIVKPTGRPCNKKKKK